MTTLNKYFNQFSDQFRRNELHFDQAYLNDCLQCYQKKKLENKSKLIRMTVTEANSRIKRFQLLFAGKILSEEQV